MGYLGRYLASAWLKKIQSEGVVVCGGTSGPLVSASLCKIQKLFEGLLLLYIVYCSVTHIGLR